MSSRPFDWVAAADELLRPERMFEGSCDFLRAWELLARHRDALATQNTQERIPVQARATCASMALELALKSLITFEGKNPVSTHSFARLFKQLFAKTRTEIASRVLLDGKPTSVDGVSDALKRCEGTFEKWRYAHEHRDLDFYEPYIIQVTNAAHEVLTRRVAEWNARSHAVRERRNGPLTTKQAQELVTRAVDSLLFEDGDLPHDVNERTLAHRLAVHLEQEIRRLGRLMLGPNVNAARLRVDCEYNRFGIATKTLHPLATHMKREAGERFDWPTDTRGRTVYPDIIVHQRGEAGPNLIVIEVKRRGAPAEAVSWDIEKLALYRDELGYQHAFLVLFDRDQRKAKVQSFGRKSRRSRQ